MNIDFHAHVLPKADHGSDSLETSLRQLALAQAAHIDLLAATPHFYPQRDSFSSFLSRREQTEHALRAAMPRGVPELIVGAEVQLCVGLHHSEHLRQLCLQGTKVMLLELPFDFSLRAYERTLEALLYESGLTVVLAHIDRYRTDVIELLLDMGFLAQLNASSFCHLRTRRRSMQWALSESIVALGSDIHGTDVGYKEFIEMKNRLGSGYDEIMRRCAVLLGRS